MLNNNLAVIKLFIVCVLYYVLIDVGVQQITSGFGLLLFYLEFCDAIREGDGERILRCW